MLISVIGGRIIPSFTRNWLVKRGAATLPSPASAVDKLALATLHAGMFGWVLLPSFQPLGALLLIAAVCNLWRLVRWRGAATVSGPLLLVLHIGYAWLVAGAGVLGLSILDPGVPVSAAIHALTAGAFATMILAVMTRATRGHTGGTLSADRGTLLIYLGVTLAAATRIAAVCATGWTLSLLIWSGCLWIVGFGGFVLLYGPMLLGRHPLDLK